MRLRRRRRRRARSEVLGRVAPGWVTAVLVGGTAILMLGLERRRPLRARREPWLRHDARNAAMAATTAATVRLLEAPMTLPLARLVHRRRIGIARIGLPAWAEVALGVVLLDYLLYVWHVLTHRVGFLWRFHRVHHTDLDLDATTALRFHFAEMALSVPWRLMQVALVGASPLALSAWQTATLVAILFHHSNVELPPRAERVLARLVMTPRMHGIHHSIVRRETDSNWSTILSWPDYLHRTHLLDVPQGEVTAGVPEYQDEEELRLGGLLAMPFGAQRPAWRRPDGTVPERSERPGPRAALLP